MDMMLLKPRLKDRGENGERPRKRMKEEIEDEEEEEGFMNPTDHDMWKELMKIYEEEQSEQKRKEDRARSGEYVITSSF